MKTLNSFSRAGLIALIVMFMLPAAAKSQTVIQAIRELSPDIAAQTILNGSARSVTLPERLEIGVNGVWENMADVTWTSSPAYNQNVDGVYVFTPDFGSGYTYGQDVVVRRITVTVTTIVITTDYSFDPATGALTLITDKGAALWREMAYPALADVKKLIVGANIKGLPIDCMRGAVNLTTANVDLSGAINLRYFGAGCFAGSGLNLIPDFSAVPLTSIGDSCFARTKITSIKLPYTLTTLGVGCFKNSGLSFTVDLSNTAIISIREECFYGCSGVMNVKLPSTVRSLGKNSFRGTSLNTYLFGALDLSGCELLTFIGESCFQDIASLTTVKLPPNLLTVKGTAFGDSGLRGTVVLPASVTSVGNSAFYCPGLFSLVFTGAAAPALGSGHSVQCYYPASAETSYKAQAHLPASALGYAGNQAELVTFSLASGTGTYGGNVDHANKTIFITLPEGVNRASLVPVSGFIGKSITPDELTSPAANFTNPVTLTVTALDGTTTAVYTVYTLTGLAQSSQTAFAGQSAGFMIDFPAATAIQWQVNKGSGFVDIPEGEGEGAQTPEYFIPAAALNMNGWQYRAKLTVPGYPYLYTVPAVLGVTAPQEALYIRRTSLSTTQAVFEQVSNINIETYYILIRYTDALKPKGVGNIISTNNDGIFNYVNNSDIRYAVYSTTGASDLVAISNSIIFGGGSTPFIPVTGKMEVGQTITIHPYGLLSNQYHATFYSMQWIRDGAFIPGTEGKESYTLTESDKGCAINARVLVDGIPQDGEASRLTITFDTNNTTPVAGYAQTAPSAPVVDSSDASSVTLTAIAGAEYSCGGAIWQDSPVFDNLPANTAYTFYARLKETYFKEASPASAGTEITLRSINPSAEGIVYVTENGAGMKDGSSWANACPGLADVLEEARTNASAGIQQIWAAQGTYLPKYKAGNGTSDRHRAFTFAKDVKVYGGFSGTDDAETVDSREAMHCVSTLSGDLGLSGDNADNAYHVVIGAGNLGTAILDGFTITGGNADGSSSISVSEQTLYDSHGAGIILVGSASPEISNCIITGNAAVDGAGMLISASSPVMKNSLVTNNTATRDAGGLYCYAVSTPQLVNLTIAGNTAPNGDGVYVNGGATPQFYNSIVWGSSTAALTQGTGTPAYYNSLVKGITAADAAGNLAGTSDPIFAGITDYRLQEGSPCIDTGNNTYFTDAATATDLAGNPRVYNTAIDLGAYEFQGVTAPVITITEQPVATTVTEGSIFGSLSVTASVSPEAALAYQWYSNTVDSNTNGTSIDNATGTIFDIPTDLSAGTVYYYVEVNAPGAIPATSNTAAVTVTGKSTGIGNVQTGGLHARAGNGGLRISGLVPGEIFSIYSVHGQMLYQAEASDNDAWVVVHGHGIYIVVSGEERIKAVY